MSILLLALLFASALANEFKWDFKMNISDVTYGHNFVSQFSSNGIAHLFWIETNKGSPLVLYQALRPDRTLSEKKVISAGTLPLKISSTVAAQVSNDGSHVLAAYSGYRVSAELPCDAKFRGSCFEIFFTESFNGGKDWSKPARMPRKDMNDPTRRSSPAILLEKDTGRVHIAYNKDYNLSIAIREPGKKNFEQEVMINKNTYAEGMALGYTVSGERRHVHWFWTEPTGKTLHHRYSNDSGKTWSDDMVTLYDVKVRKYPAVAINPEIMEGGIYVQYYEVHDTIRKDIRMIWSRDHGEFWEGPAVLDETYYNANAIAMCGTKEKPAIISTNVATMVTPGYIRFIPTYSNKPSEIPYPFNGVDIESLGYSDISCVHVKNGEYLVTHMVLDDYTNSIYLAHGIMKDTT
eukprot:TRINITY_DN2365_c0_g2_i1.p1 TRINITY_DN2365_c0_g2~~TRINITY_DN2365_c0_g2_i1.p1  ORF type:complete len:406 (+),score=34.65 TRINITY_DN2365_c0_g2_i1:177-1394(+)